ncbi:MAG: menaquinone biosynthesis protein [Ferruginibacter sp.]
MESKIRVTAVDYLNTKPLIWGFENGLMQNEIALTLDYPANIAKMLVQNETDVGLLPVVNLQDMTDYHIISDYCIAANSEVASVCLLSQVPLQQIETILLDYQSRTSVALLKILLKKYWRIAPHLQEAEPGYEKYISGNTAALVIGDRALILRNSTANVYDLATAWNEMTGLPFVFAAWVANKKLSHYFIQKFNEATGTGLVHIDEIVAANPYPYYDLKVYYQRNIDYNFTKDKMEGLQYFLELLPK